MVSPSPDARKPARAAGQRGANFEVATGREAAPLLRFLGLRSATLSPMGGWCSPRRRVARGSRTGARHAR